MATSTAVMSPVPPLEISEDQYDQLRELADSQRISVSDALRQAISLSELIVRSVDDPNTKVLLKTGSQYKELKLNR